MSPDKAYIKGGGEPKKKKKKHFNSNYSSDAA